MTDLPERAGAFLQRPIPPELAKRYVSGSMTDLLIAGYVDNGTLDEEAKELLGICTIEVKAAADRYRTQEAKQYWSECAAILSSIEAELSAA